MIVDVIVYEGTTDGQITNALLTTFASADTFVRQIHELSPNRWLVITQPVAEG